MDVIEQLEQALQKIDVHQTPVEDLLNLIPDIGGASGRRLSPHEVDAFLHDVQRQIGAMPDAV